MDRRLAPAHIFSVLAKETPPFEMKAEQHASSVSLTCGTRSEPDPDGPLDGGAASPQQDGGSPGGCSATLRSGPPRDQHDGSLRAASLQTRYNSAKSRYIHTNRRKRGEKTTAVFSLSTVSRTLMTSRRGDGWFSSSAECIRKII